MLTLSYILSGRVVHRNGWQNRAMLIVIPTGWRLKVRESSEKTKKSESETRLSSRGLDESRVFVLDD